MEEDELRAILRREIDSALGAEDGKLSSDRRTALEYYEGEPFGDEIEGRSKVVMRTVMETVEWVLPALLRIFCASRKIANCEPTRPGTEDAAKQATDYLSYIFYRDNRGFRILHDWFKGALIQKLGWLKVYWDTQRVVETNRYTGLTAAEYDALKGPDVTIVEERSYPAPPSGFDQDGPQPPPAPGAPPQTLYDCTLRVVRREGRVKIEPVPPEEVLTSRRAKGTEALPFLCHRRQRTITDLLQMGFDAETVHDLPSYDDEEFNSERIARYQQEDDFPYQSDRTDEPMRQVWIEESYLKVDWDGDGIAELRKITTAGNAAVILDNEEADEMPLVAICPVPMPHKLIGFSLADLVMDLQLIKSILVRQILDNIYLTNAPRTVVADGAANENTYDDLLTVRPGGLIRAARAEGIVPLPVPFVAGAAFPIVEYLDQTAETRTGVARHNQSLDADVLNKSSSGVQTHLLQQAAAQRVELIARFFADGVEEVCRRILGLVTRYQQAERVIRLTGKWVPMDPRHWRDSMDVSVSAGIGSGNRDQVLAHLMQVLQLQQQIVAMQQGVSGPLVTAPDVYAALSRLTENAGFTESFFTDPSAPPPGAPPGGAPPPDPGAMKGMQDMQIANARAQADMQIQTAKAQQELALAQQRAQAEMELEAQKAQHAMALERMREDAAAQRSMREIELRGQLGAYSSGPAPVPE